MRNIRASALMLRTSFVAQSLEVGWCGRRLIHGSVQLDCLSRVLQIDVESAPNSSMRPAPVMVPESWTAIRRRRVGGSKDWE